MTSISVAIKSAFLFADDKKPLYGDKDSRSLEIVVNTELKKCLSLA